MANTAVATTTLSTHEVCTAADREKQPDSAVSYGPLTPKQKDLVEQTWKFVEGDLQGAGILLFKRIFEIAPGAVQLFSKFRDLPKDEMYSSEPFRAHALNVTQAVDMAVSSLDDIPGLLSVLKDLGSVHCPYGIQDAHFDVVGQALIDTLQKGLGDKFTPEVKEAYIVFYTMVADKMKEGLHEGYAMQNNA